LAREAGAVLDPAEPLLLGRAHELAVDDEGGGRIAVIRVQTEDRSQAEQCMARVLSLFQLPLRDRSCG
jgi:hypothetical protein